MLQKLYIRNYAIIDELTIDFDNRFNVVTGETGAGKSIILGALSLILGDRADSSVLINKEEKCIVEAYFHVADDVQIQSILESHDLDIDAHCIIRREINAAGKSRAFINDTPVTLSVLNELTSSLVDLHRQFDTRTLLEHDFRYKILDAMSETQTELASYQKSFQNWKKAQQELTQLKEQQEKWDKEADYKQFLYDELVALDFKENEIEENESLLKQLTYAAQIQQVLDGISYGLEEGEQPLNVELKRIAQQLQSLKNIFQDAEPLAQRVESVWIELKDISNEIANLRHKVDENPALLANLQERQDIAYRLMKKHACNSTNELINIQLQLHQELKDKNSVLQQLAALQDSIDATEKILLKVADTISVKRKKTAHTFANSITQLLAQIGMPNAVLKIEVTPSLNLHAFGKDDVALLLDANKSGKFTTIQKVASGGELSRIMLAIKTLIAKAIQLPTLIFDEVDTGISGEAARQVGILLQSLGEHHQVICITHQPQVAGKGHSHYFVYKDATDNVVKTQIKKLNAEEHVAAIARMIGGDTPSEAALNNARELTL